MAEEQQNIPGVPGIDAPGTVVIHGEGGPKRYEHVTLPTGGAIAGIPGNHAPGSYVIDWQMRTIITRAQWEEINVSGTDQNDNPVQETIVVDEKLVRATGEFIKESRGE